MTSQSPTRTPLGPCSMHSRPVTCRMSLYRTGAELILEAAGLTVDDERVQHWIAVGKERRERGQDAMRAGDHWGRSDF